jgi:hypothetical protein
MSEQIPTTVGDIIDDEYNRLYQKKAQIDSALSAQQRNIVLNESYRKRYSRYTQMVIVISLALIGYLGILALRKSVPAIPEFVADLVTALIFVGAIVYCAFALFEINTRNITNYDELDLPPYVDAATQDTGKSTSASAINSGIVRANN